MTFDEAFARLIKHEGGLVNDPRDPGGLTKYGISGRAYPNEDIANLTIERAKQLCKRDYWTPAGCDRVPEHVRFHLLDAAYNSSVAAAIKVLQKAVGVEPDGDLGPQTLLAIARMTPHQFIARFNGARLAFMTSLGNWQAHGKGWARRIAANLMAA